MSGARRKRDQICDEHNGVMSDETRPPVDPAAQPAWMRTGFKFFPYAPRQSGQWWVLRFSYDFPEHEMYTLFIDGRAAADITADAGSPIPLTVRVRMCGYSANASGKNGSSVAMTAPYLRVGYSNGTCRGALGRRYPTKRAGRAWLIIERRLRDTTHDASGNAAYSL